MSLQTPHPFASYVFEHEYVRRGAARSLEFTFSYLIKGTPHQVFLRWPWSCVDTVQAADTANDGYLTQRQREMTSFERYVETQLHKHRERLYAIEGEELLVRGKA